MRIRFGKAYKVIAIVIAVAIIGEGFIVSYGSLSPLSSGAGVEWSEENGNDQKIAADISNMTGVSAERILQLKSSRTSWNEVLETLKNNPAADGPEAKAKRSLNVLDSGLGQEAVARLQAEGFAEKEILSAKLLAERTALQIQQMVGESSAKAPEALAVVPKELANPDPEAFLTELRPVAEQFDLELAVRWMLTLKAEFGSYENVLDEYLRGLQVQVSLEDYVKDKTQYAQNKAQKESEKIGLPVISLNELERRLLEKIKQDQDASQAAGDIKSNESNLPAAVTAETIKNPLPEAVAPKIKDVKPVSPAAAIQEELRKIDPNLPSNRGY